MKRWGILTGALIALIAIYAFDKLTAITDDDRLAYVLTDHCLPFVKTGTPPFAGFGRAPGVYDNVTLRETITDGGARLIYDNRFTAQWGTVTGAGRMSRMCEITPTQGEARAAFDVSPKGFISRYTDLLALHTDSDTLPTGPVAVGWYEDPAAQTVGLRVVMIASPGLVANIVVMDDLPAQ